MAQLQVTESGSWQLHGALNFATVTSVCALGVAKLNQIKVKGAELVVQVDLSQVTYSNSAGLALLLEWTRVAQPLGIKVFFHHMPEQMRAIASVCGVFDAITGN